MNTPILKSKIEGETFAKVLENLKESTNRTILDNDWIIATDFTESKLNSKDINIIIRTKKAVAGKPSKPHPTKDKYKANHFLCTWKSEGYIDEITDDHCLIFNMFGECYKHLLLMTKHQED